MRSRPSLVVRLSSAALIATVAAAPAAGQLVGPVYPPPGGVTFAGSGSAGQSSGRLNQYTGMDPSQYSALYFTFNSIQNPCFAPTGSTPCNTGDMVFSNYDAGTGIATFLSTANVNYTNAQGTSRSLATQLRVQFQNWTGVNSGQLASGWLTPTTAVAAGIATLPAPWPVLDVAALAPADDRFQVWYRWEIQGTNQPLLAYYDADATVQGTVIRTSLSGGFYASTVPEPATLTLALVGVGTLALGARRRQASRASRTP